jgi:hypothetical protein
MEDRDVRDAELVGVVHQRIPDDLPSIRHPERRLPDRCLQLGQQASGDQVRVAVNDRRPREYRPAWSRFSLWKPRLERVPEGRTELSEGGRLPSGLEADARAMTAAAARWDARCTP